MNNPYIPTKTGGISQQWQAVSWIVALLVAFGLGLVGHAAYWLLSPALSPLLAWGMGLAAFGLAGYLVWRKFTFRGYPLRSSLPHGPSSPLRNCV